MWPTLEDAAAKFEVGEPTGRRAERPRQIIKEKFRNTASLEEFPKLKFCAEIILSRPVHSGDTLISELLSQVFFEGEVNLRGLLNILHDLGACKDFEIYSSSLTKTQRSSFQLDDTLLVIQKDQLKSLRKHLKTAKTLPGQLGIADINYLRSELPDLDIFSELVAILKMDKSLAREIVSGMISTNSAESRYAYYLQCGQASAALTT